MEQLNSRADYFRERRRTHKYFTAEVDRKMLGKLEAKLEKQKKTKTKWLNEKIEEELKE